MKQLFTLISFVILSGSFHILSAQESDNTTLNQNPIYDYSEKHLNNTDTIPGFLGTDQKLKITGTIYLNDGVTPAKNVLLYIEQADENGNYQIQTKNNKNYMLHRAWIKTGEDGKYTFYTFVPGGAIDPITFPRRRGLKKIYPIIKTTIQPEYNLDALLFDNDPLLTKACRKKLNRKGIDSILKLQKTDDLWVVTRDIVLDINTTASR